MSKWLVWYTILWFPTLLVTFKVADSFDPGMVGYCKLWFNSFEECMQGRYPNKELFNIAMAVFATVLCSPPFVVLWIALKRRPL